MFSQALNELGYERDGSKPLRSHGRRAGDACVDLVPYGVPQVDVSDPLILGHSCISGEFFMG